MTRNEKAIKVLEIVEEFIKKNEVFCEESVFQCDWIYQGCPDLVADLCDVVGYLEHEEDGKENIDSSEERPHYIGLDRNT